MNISASGERGALTGYMHQFGEFAWFAYRELLSGQLQWVRLADPEAYKLDDIQYATGTQIHAYQVKWTISGDIVSFADFKQLFADLVSSWQQLRGRYQAGGQQVIGHLLTNKAFSTRDRILTKGVRVGSFAEFYQEVWLEVQQGQPYAAKWTGAVAQLRRLAKLTEGQFREFVADFRLHPLHEQQAFGPGQDERGQLYADLLQLRDYLLSQVIRPERPVQLTATALVQALGWEGRLHTKFNHALAVNEDRYQPVTSTLASLDEQLTRHTGGYLFLVGGPGSGKSTLLTQWARGRTERIIKYYAFDFTNPSSGWSRHRSRGESAYLYFDLVTQLKAAGLYAEQQLPSLDSAFLLQTFTKQLAAAADDFARTGRKTILLLDGLDHVPREYPDLKESFLRDLPRPQELPVGVYLVLGSQSYDLPDLPRDLRRAGQTGDRTVRMDLLDRPAVLAYLATGPLANCLSLGQQHEVYDISKGHPLYLTYLCGQLQGAAPADVARTLAEVTPFDGDVDRYYAALWEPIAEESAVVELLGLLARIDGPVNPRFIKEWGYPPAALESLRKKASFLFDIGPDGWAFFHNSFRQFLLRQTAFDYLLDEVDVARDQAYHRQLATFYQQSRVEQPWSASYHFYHAGETTAFVASTTPDKLSEQFLSFRPPGDLRRDINLGLLLARQLHDVVLLTRYVLALSELNQRLEHVDPADFVKELLELGKPGVARRYLRAGNSLHVTESVALWAAKLPDWEPDRQPPEPRVLFRLAQPHALRPDGIVVDDTARFEEVQGPLRAWAAIALEFEPLAVILPRLTRIIFTGNVQQHTPKATAAGLRLMLLTTLAHSAVRLRQWDDFEALLLEITAMGWKAARTTLFQLRQLAIEANGDDPASQLAHLAALLALVTPAKATDKERIRVADLLYQVTGDLNQVRPWLAGVAQPVVRNQEWPSFEHTLERFEPLLVLNRLLQLDGRGIPALAAVSITGTDAEERLLAEFQQKLCLINELAVEGLARTYQDGNLLARIYPLVGFYYQDSDDDNSDDDNSWFRIRRLRGAYFDLLIEAVASLGASPLSQLATYLLREFSRHPRHWDAAARRRVLTTLHVHGLAAEVLRPALHELEATMRAGQDLSSRAEECRAQARACLQLGDHPAAEYWLQQTLREAFGVGYRKDYQINAWLRWLRRINEVQPQQARERLRWVAAHLQHLRELTEGRAAWLGAEKLLETTLAWNMAAGQQLFGWLLGQGRIHLEVALAEFLVAYLDRAQTGPAYDSIFQVYTDLLLPLAEAPNREVLRRLLAVGADQLGEELFSTYLPRLIMAISRRGLQEHRAALLTTLDEFVTSRGRRTTDVYADFAALAGSALTTAPGRNELARTGQPRLTEEQVLAQVNTYADLRELLTQEDRGNSYFNWHRVLEQVGGYLSAGQLRDLGLATPGGERRAVFYSTLSGLALRAGERALARQLADKGVQLSSGTGWLAYYDGGTRLAAFAALGVVEPVEARHRAFEAFTHDVRSDELATAYAEKLDDILPFLTEELPLPGIWEEVSGYLRRLLLTAQPLTDLPALEAEAVSLEEVLSRLLHELALHPVIAVQQRARHLLAGFAARGDAASCRVLQQLAGSAVPEAEALVEILELMSLPVQQAIITQYLAPQLSELALLADYWVRRQARKLLAVANLPVPIPPRQPLPAVYELSLAAPPSSKGLGGAPSARAFAVSDAVEMCEVWLTELAAQTGLPQATLARRLEMLLTTDGACDWPAIAGQLQERLRQTGLDYSCPRPLVVAARRALRYLTTELLDADRFREAAIARLFTFRDYLPATFPEQARPAFVQPLSSYIDTSEWLRAIGKSDRLAEPLLPYGPEQVVIGEYTRVRELSWEQKEETYMMQLARPEGIDKEQNLIFGTVFQYQTEDYERLPVRGMPLMVVRKQRFGQFTLKSDWLAFNPKLARQLGWHLLPHRLFAWADAQGAPMVESVYWVDGNVEMQANHANSGVGEGWLVLASPAALEQLQTLVAPLLLDKRLTRSHQRESPSWKNTIRTTRPL